MTCGINGRTIHEAGYAYCLRENGFKDFESAIRMNADKGNTMWESMSERYNRNKKKSDELFVAAQLTSLMIDDIEDTTKRSNEFLLSIREHRKMKKLQEELKDIARQETAKQFSKEVIDEWLKDEF